MKTFIRTVSVATASILLGLTAFGSSISAPNFVFILADDQGWNALSVRMDPDVPGSGSTYYQTPNLEQMAARGMRFSQAYAPAPTCSPTRHAIQFGRTPTSLKIFGADRIDENFDAESGDSLAHKLKQANPDYVCAHLGKWHIARTPGELGYDLHDGMTKNQEGNSEDPEDPKKIFDLSRRANAFIEEQVNAGTPFFIQISHYADHLVYQARKETIRKYETERAGKATPYQKDPLWAAMNEDLDTGVGMVLDKIEELGIGDNTYVIYTADNGFEDKFDFGKPVHNRDFYKAYPQRSHKYHVSEGGIRVPFIIQGPGIPAGTHSPEPVVGTDILPTVLDLAGGKRLVPKDVEGGSIAWHAKSGGKKPVRRNDPFLVFKYTKQRAPHDIALVQGKYKLLKDINTGKLFLFDLHNDVGERKNLASEKPEMAERMYKDLTTYFARFGWDESQIEFTQEPKKNKK
ncbi:MAG: sulfatase-like hydrolase/transferase [Puniceicoccaceae bacterium]